MFPLHDNNPTERWSVVNYALIALNILAFVWLSTLPPPEQMQVILHHGFIPQRIAQLEDPKLEVKIDLGNPQEQQKEKAEILERRDVPPVVLKPDAQEIYLSVLTCMFLHGGWLHVLGNMWFLFIFGNNIEDRLGHVLYLFFYLLGGILATAVHWMTDTQSTIPVIGASGAVAAVLGAYAITFPFARVKTLIFLIVFVTVIELPALVVLGFWFVGQLLSANEVLKQDINGGVAFMAHIGGFLAGLIIMPFLSKLLPKPDPTPWNEQRFSPFA